MCQWKFFDLRYSANTSASRRRRSLEISSTPFRLRSAVGSKSPIAAMPESFPLLLIATSPLHEIGSSERNSKFIYAAMPSRAARLLDSALHTVLKALELRRARLP